MLQPIVYYTVDSMSNYSLVELEAVAYGGVYVCIVLELAEESAWIIAEEYVGAGLDSQIIADLVIYIRPHVHIFIRRRKVRKK